MSRILIVDDEPDIRFMMRLIFERAGHQVAEAGNGAVGLTSIKATQPDLVQGRPEWALEAGQTSYEASRAREFDIVSDDYEKVTGQKPTTIAQVIAADADEMPLAVPRRSP